MGDPVLPENSDLLPQTAQYVVGQRHLVDAVERAAVDHVVAEQKRVLSNGRDAAQTRRTHTDVTGLKRHERLVFDGTTQ